MQLKAFDKNEKQKNNKTTILVVVVFLFVVTLVLGKSFAYYQKIEDKNVLSTTAEICTVKSGTTWDFEYVEDDDGNGYEQEFVVPCTGNYRLETWGAGGGNISVTYQGGKGGYSRGNINLSKNTNLYINVGGTGGYKTNGSKAEGVYAKGGYNGGGTGLTYNLQAYHHVSGGGGATHIATKSGILSTLKNNIDDILIVSGGGSGTYYFTNDYRNVKPGNGGGYMGTNGSGTHTSFGITYSSAGTQDTGVFGQGSGGSPNNPGAGGGYHGGNVNLYSGGGGSGYIGNNNLFSKVMYCYECSESIETNTRTISTTNVSEDPISEYTKKGNGYARVTYLGYNDSELNGADPVLKEGLVPVKIESDGTVRKANPQAGWYNYKNKEWANAVILVDKTKSYEYGAVIPEANIESYFVWIPKFSYKLWDLGNYNGSINETPSTGSEREIEIRFGITNTSDSNTGECTTPMESGSSGNCVVGDFMTHPAFISMEVNGLWVAKFETGYKGATSTTEAEVNSNDSSKIIIKPNTYSWRNNSIYNQFVSSYNYQRTLDSHMMKNTEWGAVAYLSHSKYGINMELIQKLILIIILII